MRVLEQDQEIAGRLDDLKSELLIGGMRLGFVVHVILSKIPGSGLGRGLIGNFATGRVDNSAFAGGIPVRAMRRFSSSCETVKSLSIVRVKASNSGLLRLASDCGVRHDDTAVHFSCIAVCAPSGGHFSIM
jgi:hypothetical protein